jgi:histidinol-phosphate phosphatase family protein
MQKLDQAVILCGGKGTRLLPYTSKVPKPMILCNDKPFLWYLLNQLYQQGISRFVLLTGYLSDTIEEYFKDGSSFGWEISYSKGPVNWLTGRRLWEAKSFLDDSFLLLYSDNFAPFSLEKILSIHYQYNRPLTFMVSKKSPGNISLGSNGIVKEYNNTRSDSKFKYVEIGYMIVEKEKTFSNFEEIDCSFSLVLQKMAINNQINAFVQDDAYYSISDPQRWKLSEKYLKPKKIILIDRDGVINKKSKKGRYINSWTDFKWIDDTRLALKQLAKEGFKFVIITNQAGVARGITDPKELEKIHSNIINEFKKDNICILGIYSCPHHWDDDCDCRKPKAGMFFNASYDLALRLDQTIFIGDDIRDCIAAYNAGTKSVFIGNNKELTNLSQEMMPIFTTKNLSESVSNIIEHFNYL